MPFIKHLGAIFITDFKVRIPFNITNYRNRFQRIYLIIEAGMNTNTWYALWGTCSESTGKNMYNAYII